MSSKGRTARRSRVHTVDNVRPTWHQTPVVQWLLAFWRWLPDILVGGTVLIGAGIAYYQLTKFRGYDEQHLPLPWWAALAVILLPFAVLAAIPHSRRAFLVMWWLNVTRHRLRSYMAQNQIRNRDGRLPWLICIYPTKVGERAFMWLPAGLSIQDITDEEDSLGATCYAREGHADVPNKNYAHIVRMDIHRRDLLETQDKVPSTLVNKNEDLDLLPADDSQQNGSVTTSSTAHAPSDWAVGIGLPRTTLPDSHNGDTGVKKPTGPASTGQPSKAIAVSDSGEDLSDYV